MNGADDDWDKQANPISRDVHEKPRHRDQHCSRAIRSREEQSERPLVATPTTALGVEVARNGTVVGKSEPARE
jgi:hypothetical protein